MPSNPPQQPKQDKVRTLAAKSTEADIVNIDFVPHLYIYLCEQVYTLSQVFLPYPSYKKSSQIIYNNNSQQLGTLLPTK